MENIRIKLMEGLKFNTLMDTNLQKGAKFEEISK